MQIKETGKQLDITALKGSPVHDLKPLNEEAQRINIEDIDMDKTNPGSVTESLRYQRRAPSIRDSYDILGRIVYPIIVCKNAEHTGRYIQVDGFGRLEQLKQRQISDKYPEVQELVEQFERNFLYEHSGNYTQEERVKTFTFIRDKELEEVLLKSIELAVEYYQTITLNMIE